MMPDRRVGCGRITGVESAAWLAAARIDPVVTALRPDYRALLVVAEDLGPGPGDDWSEALLAAAERDAPPADTRTRWPGPRRSARSAPSRSGPGPASPRCSAGETSRASTG